MCEGRVKAPKESQVSVSPVVNQKKYLNRMSELVDKINATMCHHFIYRRLETQRDKIYVT